MKLPPKEFIYRDKHSIDEFIDNDELNSDIYDVLLKVREQDSSIGRYNLKRSSVEILNEAYYQATKAFFDKHPEDNFDEYYVKDTRCHLGLAYETTLVLSIVYTILASQETLTKPLSRFVSAIEAKYKEDKCYFQFFKDLVDLNKSRHKTYNSVFSRPEVDLSNLETKDWKTLTGKYDKGSIEAYINLGIDEAQKLKILDAIQTRYKIDVEMDELGFMFNSDLTSFFNGLRKLINLQNGDSTTQSTEEPKEPANPLSGRVKELEKQITSLNKQITDLVQQNDELKNLKSEERSIPIRTLLQNMKSLPRSAQSSLITMLRSIVAEQDENWVEKFNLEEKRLSDEEATDDSINLEKPKLPLSVATDLMLILFRKMMVASYANNTSMANLIGLITNYSSDKIRQRLSNTTPIAKRHTPQVEAVNTILDELGIKEQLSVASK